MTSVDQEDRATSLHAATGRPWSRSTDFGDALVHADGRGEHAGTDVGHAHRLEVPLQDAILAERAVEGREDDGARRQAGTEMGERQAGILAQQVVRRGQRLDIGHVGQDPVGVHPLACRG